MTRSLRGDPRDGSIIIGILVVISALINSVNPTMGFNNDGLPCTEFDPLNGNDSCPLRFNVRWWPVCTGLCINPEIKISINLNFKPRTQRGIINLSREMFTFYRNPIADSLEITCASLGGAFDSAWGRCQWTRVASTCSQSNQLFVGFDTSGNELCEPLQEQVCPAGTWMKGVDLDGNLVCQAS